MFSGGYYCQILMKFEFSFPYFHKKVKQWRNRPGVAQSVPGDLGSQISWHSARKGGEVVSLTHRQPLLQECSWYSFTLGAESTPGPWYVRNAVSLKNPVTPPGIDSGTVRLVAQCLKHYSTTGLNFLFLLLQNNIKFHAVRPFGTEYFYADERTDRKDEANSRFSQ